ncbi:MULTISPECIES: peptidoglycan-binding domain-containing protein [unclassified Ekhidna]|uniref:peptidoglycan-binding domain-containing protein n=1 Tax=unclassified Ekhidna TaxID=2632188 RepID=UPI0032DF46C2
MIKKHYIKELNISKLLKVGEKGYDVQKVQEWLNLWRFVDPGWFHRVSVDGDYGQQTEAVVRDFQAHKKLEVDGVVGPNTFRVLCSPMFNAFSRINGSDLRQLIVAYARQHLQNIPRELYNSNIGPWVRAYMDGNEGKEWAWCMGFVQTILDQATTTIGKRFTEIMPHSYSCDVVGSHGLKEKKLHRNVNVRSNPQLIEPGDVFLNMKTQYDWVHTGIVIGVEGDWMHTIEGNTNDEGSREGFEVCLRRRNFQAKTIDIYKVI